jgi:peptide/nickel transport system substrate-binding protein
MNVSFESDPHRRLTLLTAGRVHFAGGLDAEGARLVRGAAGLAVLETPSNEFLSLDIGSAPGSAGENVLVRRALKLGTDRAALAEAVRPSLAAPGNDSPVGPLYGERHLDVVPRQDTEAAKVLLTEAGVTGGLQFALDVPDDGEAQALAEAWGLQMEAIGVAVEIRDTGIGAGTDGAEPAAPDGTITRWPSEMSPLTYLERGYPAGSGSGDTQWGDPDLDAAIGALAGESDEAAQVALYHQIQQILIDRGPSVVPFYETAVAGVNDKLRGVTLAPYWPRTTFRTASFGS